jgi:DNA-binding XRE family transcriptional regulator
VPQASPLLSEVREAQLPPPAVRRGLRQMAGLTIREAAATVGVSHTAFLKWENGTMRPRRQHAVAYRRFLESLREALHD